MRRSGITKPHGLPKQHKITIEIRSEHPYHSRPISRTRGAVRAVNPRQPRQLLVACQASPVIPESIVTYVSLDGGASWQNGGVPAQPASGPAGDDVTVAFDAYGRGYICATHSGHGSNVNPNPDNNRAVYVWRTDDGGRSFSAPVTVVEGQYCDHPWLATGQGQTSVGHDVYVAWGAETRTRPSTLRSRPMVDRASSRRAGSLGRPQSPL